MMGQVTDRVTYGVAAGGLTTEWWYEWLMSVSEMAAILLPVLSVIWVFAKLVEFVLKRVDKDD